MNKQKNDSKGLENLWKPLFQAFFSTIVQERAFSFCIKISRNIDPYDVFNSDIDATVNINNLCIIDFKEKGFHHVEKISWQDAYNYAEQFSLGINVYRLEEDLLDYCRNDFKKFSEFYETMKFILADTIKNCNCYYISTDLLVNANKEEVINLLSK